MKRAYISLGSNLGNPVEQVNRAVVEIARLPCSKLLRVSPWYNSRPLGPSSQPDYINGVLAIDTRREPLALLSALQEIEQAHRRERTLHWGPRTLDLDILLYSNIRLQHPDLKLPHPQLTARNFVIYPLYDIEPKLVLPDGTTLRQYRKRCSSRGLRRLPARVNRYDNKQLKIIGNPNYSNNAQNLWQKPLANQHFAPE